MLFLFGVSLEARTETCLKVNEGKKLSFYCRIIKKEKGSVKEKSRFNAQYPPENGIIFLPIISVPKAGGPKAGAEKTGSGPLSFIDISVND